MKSVCRYSCVGLTAVFLSLAISPSTAEARRWRRYGRAAVVRRGPVYVAPVRQYYGPRYPAVYRRYPIVYRGYPGVNVVAPGVRVNVGGYRGVRVGVGGWGW